MIQIGVFSKNHHPELFVIAATAHCGKKATKYHRTWIKLLAEVRIDRFILLSFHSDGCAAWRSAKKQLYTDSILRLDTKLQFVSRTVIGPDVFNPFFCGSDVRHNIKGFYKKISLRRVKVCDVYINIKMIQKYIERHEIWKKAECTKNRCRYVLNDGYSKDPMNVTNPLLFLKIVVFIN